MRSLFCLIVSIHVPARGTTAYLSYVTAQDPVSIHVPARGTTRENSGYNNTLDVSIHVPARGTTADGMNSMADDTTGFNPRSRKGNDLHNCAGRKYLSRFQSTFPQGERHNDWFRDVNYDEVSIHVPARGTTTQL